MAEVEFQAGLYKSIHTLEIEYCAPCNYLDLALGLQEEFLAQWAPIVKSVTVVPTAWGTFEVTLDGELIFSKHALGRHALPGELSKLIEERIGAPLEEFVMHSPEQFDARGFPAAHVRTAKGLEYDVVRGHGQAHEQYAEVFANK